jgi:hypothetical protein
MGRSSKIIAGAALLIFAGTFMLVSQNDSTGPALRRSLSVVTVDGGAATTAAAAAEQVEQPIKKYRLPEQAQSWCEPSVFPPLNYNSCNPNDTVYQIAFMAGLTNGLKMMLLMVIAAFEENRCFFVTENHNHLLIRDDKTQELDTFIGRYFEPIGLSETDPIVKNARQEGRIQKMDWQDYWNHEEKRRTHGRLNNITSLGYENIESTILKKVMLQRMWRLLPPVREDSCNSLEMHNLEQEYMAFSVRRGDKDTEGFEFTKPQDYIVAAEQARDAHFGGSMPKIFVATDDCAVMGELRSMRPEWAFESECDRSDGHSGFILADMKKWTLAQTVRLFIHSFLLPTYLPTSASSQHLCISTFSLTQYFLFFFFKFQDEHYRKFYVELFGLAGAKFYIGVSYTNVAWWAAYMRPHRWSHQFLDSGPNRPSINILNAW